METAATIGAAAIFWQVQHFRDRVSNPATSSIERRTLLTSTTFVVTLLSVLFLLVGSILIEVVAVRAARSDKLGIDALSLESILLFACLGMPFLVGVLGLVSVAGYIDSQSIAAMLKRILRRGSVFSTTLRFQPLREGTVPVDPTFVPPPERIEEWRTAFEMVKDRAGDWELGRGFVDRNREALLSYVDKVWRSHAEDSALSSSAMVDELAEMLSSELEQEAAYPAMLHSRPRILAEAALHMYSEEAKRARNTEVPDGH